MKTIPPAFRIVLAAVCLVLTACGCPQRTLSLRLEKRNQHPDIHFCTPFDLTRQNGPLKQILPAVKGLPDGWEAFSVAPDFPQALYQAFCAGRVDTATCMRYFNAWQFDTARYSAIAAQVFLTVALGRDADGVEQVMYDTDGDCDFTGETIYPYGQRPARVEMAYERIVDKRPVPDVTWVEIDDYYWGRSLVQREMTQTRFTLDSVEYACTVYPGNPSYQADGTVIRIAGADTVDYRIGEYAHLGDAWYRLDTISLDGRSLHLTCVPDAESLESRQIGFRPFSFTAVDMNGRTIRFPDDFAGKHVLLDIWALSCAPCRIEICNSYPDIYARYRDSGFEIVSVAEDSADDLREFLAEHPVSWTMIADPERRIGRGLYGVNIYPTLLLIGPDGRILQNGSELRSCGLDYMLRGYMPDAPQPDGSELSGACCVSAVPNS